MISTSDKSIALWLALLVACLALLVSEGAITGSDGRSTYTVGKSVVERGTVAVEPSFGIPGRHGLYYSKYGLGLSAVAAAAYAAVKPVARYTPFPDLLGQAGAASMMPIICGLLVSAIYLLSRRLNAGPKAAALAAIGALGGTMLLPYSKEFFSEPLTALFITVSIERALAGRSAAAGFAASAAVLTRPQAFAFVPLVVWCVWRKEGRSGSLQLAASFIPGLALSLAYNLVRFGSPFEFGYGGEHFSTPFLSGATTLLFDVDKSVFLFAPIVILLPPAFLQLYTRSREAFWLLCGNLAVTFVIAAAWVSPQGGWTWGPRLLIIGVVPAIAAIAPWCEGSVLRKRLVAGLFVLGSLASAPAMIVSTMAQQLDQPTSGPGIVRQYELIRPTTAYTLNHLYEYKPGMNREYLNLWQVNAVRLLGRPGVALAALLSGALLLGAGASANALRRRLV